MKLKSYLEKKCITISEFAKICGVCRTHVWKVCNGHRQNLSVKTAYSFMCGSKGELAITDFIQDTDIKAIKEKIDV